MCVSVFSLASRHKSFPVSPLGKILGKMGTIGSSSFYGTLRCHDVSKMQSMPTTDSAVSLLQDNFRNLFLLKLFNLQVLNMCVC